MSKESLKVDDIKTRARDCPTLLIASVDADNSEDVQSRALVQLILSEYFDCLSLPRNAYNEHVGLIALITINKLNLS